MATYAPTAKWRTLRYCRSCYNALVTACTCAEYPGAPHFHLKPNRCAACQAPLQGENLVIEQLVQAVRRQIAVKVRQEIDVTLPILPDGTLIHLAKDRLRLVLANGERTGACGQEVWYDAYYPASWEAFAEPDGAVVETPYGWIFYRNYEGNEAYCYCSVRFGQPAKILGQRERCHSK